MPLYRQEYIPPIQPFSPGGQRGGIDVSEVRPGQKAPSIQIKVEYDKKDPKKTTIIPTRESIRELAEWYKKNGVDSDMRVTITGPEIGEKELPGLFSQVQNFDELEFQKWAFTVMGAGVIGERPEPELPILRKIYGNLGVIEQMRNEKYKFDEKKGLVKNIDRIKLDTLAKEFIDKNLGNPIEFAADIDEINKRIADSKEYGDLSEEAIDYLFGLLLYAHIFNRGSTISIEHEQPAIKTGNPAMNKQWEEVMGKIHFGVKTGVPLLRGDNRSKISDYIAAYVYHHNDKRLTNYYKDLTIKTIGSSGKTSLTEADINNSNLTSLEKSFLIQWQGKESKLADIEIRQEKYVERARENLRGNSPETITRDFQRDAYGTMAKLSPAFGIAIAVGLLWAAFRMVGGPTSKLAKFTGYIAAIFGVGALIGNAGAAQAFVMKSMTDNGNMSTQAPRKKENTGDVVTDAWGDISRDVDKKWDRFSAAFTTSNDWRKLILDERVGPKLVNKYPTGAILAVLNPEPTNDYNKKWKGTPTQVREITEILDKLNQTEKETLNTMLQHTWDKYRDAQGSSPTYDQLRTGTIKDMIDAIDIQYGWFSKAWRPAYWVNEEEKATALAEFTKHPKGWKDTKIGDLMVTWFAGSKGGIPTAWKVNPATLRLITTIDPAKLESMKKVITTLWEKNGPKDPNKTLGELVAE